MYVDDLLISSKISKKIKLVKDLLSKRFKMKDMGKVKEYLGIDINYDHEKNEMK